MATILNKTEINCQLRSILQQVTDDRVKADEVNAEDEIVSSLGLSSLELLELAFEIEHTWKVVLNTQHLESCKSVSNLADLIAAQTAA
jgi:acyl carrier protein